MLSRFSRILIKRFGWVWIILLLLPVSSFGQSDSALNLKGAIDFHVHQGPDSVDRAIDADDLARLAKKMGMRGLVMKNHWEDTAALVYMIRKEVPGIDKAALEKSESSIAIRIFICPSSLHVGLGRSSSPAARNCARRNGNPGSTVASIAAL